MLTRYLESHQVKMQRIYEGHPMVSFMAVNIMAAAGILGAVFAVTFLGALPIYFLSSLF